jgi:hypothetical protein
MKYTFRTKPWPHQVKAFKFLFGEMSRTGSAGMQIPMRYGKSKIMIDVFSALHLKHGITRVMVCTTTSGLGVLEREIRLHCPYPSRIISYNGLVTEPPVEPAITWLVIHHAILYGRDYDWGESAREWKPGPNHMIEDFDPEAIAIDESHKIGDPSSMQCKMAYRYGKRARFRLTMTGTMFHRAPLGTFGQMKFMDDSVFGTHVTPFRRMYVKFGGYGNYQIVGYRNLKHLSRRIKRKVFVQEHLPFQAPVVTTTPVYLDESLPVYREMERESVVTVQGHDIVAPIILTKHLRAQQIAGGWVKTEEGQYLRVGREKMNALTDKLMVMHEEGIDKVVVGCRFIPELPDIARAARAAGYAFVALHGGVPRGNVREQRIAAFNEATQPTVFVAQIQAAAEAIDLSSASALIFYSMPESYVLYDQFKSRIFKFREKRTLLIDHIIAMGTRDVVTYLAMKLKQDVAEFLLQRPELVERITQRDDIVYHPADR